MTSVLDCFGPSKGSLALPNDDDTEAMLADDERPLECNYDVDPTDLYQAIEDKAFMAAIDMLESKEPHHNAACRTWVTRYEKDGRIRWSQLPLHGAILFKAPIKLVELLVKTYPKAVRCTNDQKMLPLHLAWRHGATDNVLHLLLHTFPEGIHAEDHKGRTPLNFSKEGDIWKKGEIVQIYCDQQGLLEESKVVNEELDLLEEKLKERQVKVEELETELDTLKRQAKEAKKTLELELEEYKQKENRSGRMTPSGLLQGATEAARSSRSNALSAANNNGDAAAALDDGKSNKRGIKGFLRFGKSKSQKAAATDTTTQTKAVDDSAPASPTKKGGMFRFKMRKNKSSPDMTAIAASDAATEKAPLTTAAAPPSTPAAVAAAQETTSAAASKGVADAATAETVTPEEDETKPVPAAE